MNKFASRKFLISVAAFLGSIAASIAGLAIADQIIAGIGIGCGVLSAGIYAACEAYVDGQSASANGTSKVITATTDSASVVKTALQPTVEEKKTEVKAEAKTEQVIK